MIVFDTPTVWVMVRQHDHAYLSGVAADHWDLAHFRETSRLQDVSYACYQHDRSWIGLDETPIWNDKAHVPYSFMDFPLIPKLRFYTWGLDETEKENPYAALLCSMHYTSFFEGATHPESQAFLLSEKKRQQRLRQFCHIKTATQEDALQYHFRLLQFCDNVSLYVCLNEPGVSKAEEYPWYRNGFKNSELFNSRDQTQIIAHWLDDRRIAFSPFPFQKPFQAQVKMKMVPKALVSKEGIAQAYENTSWRTLEVMMVRPDKNE